MFFNQFCTLSEKFSAFRRKLFSDVVITAFIVSIGSYWGNTKIDFSKRHWIYILLDDSKESFGGVVKVACTETKGTLCRSLFWFLCCFQTFCKLSETISAFCRKLFGQVVVSASSVSIGSLWGEKKWTSRKGIKFISFSETARKVSAGWSKLHSPGE